MTKISVLIATYNMAGYLPQTLDSALAQDYPDFEVIVLDDGSTDNTIEVVRRYEGRIRYHYQRNAGAANAYNKLIEMADGDYLHHLDADDLLLPGALTRLAALLDANPNAGLAHGGALVIDSAGKVYGRRHVPAWMARMRVVPSKRAFKGLLRGCHITTSTVMLRCDALKTVAPFDQRAVPGEDWDLWMRVAANYDIAFEPRTVAHYRIHPASITSGSTVECVQQSHAFTLDGIFSDPDFRYARMKGYAYACLERTIALTAARTRNRRVCAARMLAAALKSPGIIFERESIGVGYEALKSIMPRGLIAMGRRVRHRNVAVRRATDKGRA